MLAATIATTAMLGFSLGSASGLSPSPHTLFAIQTGMTRGRMAALVSCIAAVVADLAIILASILAEASLSSSAVVTPVLNVIGGLFLLKLALRNLSFRGSIATEAGATAKSLRGTFAASLTIQLLNPRPYLFWATVGTPKLVQLYPDFTLCLAYLISFLGCVFAAKLALSLLFCSLKQAFGKAQYRALVRVSALLLSVLGLSFLWHGITGLF